MAGLFLLPGFIRAMPFWPLLPDGTSLYSDGRFIRLRDTNMKLVLPGMVARLLMVMMVLPMMVDARTIDGVDIPDTYTLGDHELKLNGAGDRSKWFMDHYVASLYLPERSSDAGAIIDADEPQVITLHIISDMITSERMKDATREGFENSTGGDTSGIPEEVEAFLDVFSEKIRKGDVYDIIYRPGKGIEVRKNDEKLVTIGDLGFKKAVFGIWLSDKPAQKELKKDMLGQ